MTTELWIESEYLQEIWDKLDSDKIIIRAEFDERTRERIKFLYDEIRILKQDGVDGDKKPHIRKGYNP